MSIPTNLLIVDTETSSLDPTTGSLLEVAAAVWNIEHRTLVSAQSWLVQAPSNAAIAVNGIPEGILSAGIERDDVMRHVYNIATKECDAIVAHGADFDRKWFDSEIQRLQWACSCNDMAWPRKSQSRSLISLALAHGVGVVSAHRALDDVMTLVRLLERAAELGVDIAEMVTRALRPKVLVAAETPKPWEISADEWSAIKGQLHEAGFRFVEQPSKRWERRMPLEDTATLPFPVRQVA